MVVADEFERLLGFENESRVLEYRFQYQNLLIWPYVRYAFFRQAVEHRNGQKPEITPKTSILVTRLGKITCKMQGFILALMSKKPIPNKEILFMFANVANVKNDDGKIFNRLFDEFALVFASKTLVLETPVKGFSSENRVFPEVISSRYLDYAVWFGSILSKQNREDIKSVDAFLEYMRKSFPYELSTDFYLNMRKILLQQAKKLKIQDKLFRRFLKRVAPKVVFMEDACYGYDKAYRIWIVNDMKIPIYEIQHGLVSTSHEAYNYSDLLIHSKEYQQYMPKGFLAFGEFWKKNVRLPIPCQALGSANFTENKKRAMQINKMVPGRILIVLTDIIEPMVEVVNFLLKQLNESYSIVVKAHPLERSVQSEFAQFGACSNFHFYSTGNIFDFIGQSEYVVGDYSTSLYEAVGYGKEVFVYRCELSEKHISQEIGVRFSSPKELYELIINRYEDEHILNPEYYFDSCWRENYVEIVNGELMR